MSAPKSPESASEYPPINYQVDAIDMGGDPPEGRPGDADSLCVNPAHLSLAFQEIDPREILLQAHRLHVVEMARAYRLARAGGVSQEYRDAYLKLDAAIVALDAVVEERSG